MLDLIYNNFPLLAEKWRLSKQGEMSDVLMPRLLVSK